MANTKFYKIIPLRFLGQEQEKAFIKVIRPTYEQTKKVLVVQKIAEEDPTKAAEITIKWLQDQFVEGKIVNEFGELEDLTKEDFEKTFPIDTIAEIIKQITGPSAF